jgi:hypothetical protein
MVKTEIKCHSNHIIDFTVCFWVYLLAEHKLWNPNNLVVKTKTDRIYICKRVTIKLLQIKVYLLL